MTIRAKAQGKRAGATAGGGQNMPPSPHLPPGGGGGGVRVLHHVAERGLFRSAIGSPPRTCSEELSMPGQEEHLLYEPNRILKLQPVAQKMSKKLGMARGM